MIAFLLYALTAAVVLFGYLLFDFMFHALAAVVVPSPFTGAIVLLAAALLNFWKRRVAAGAALLGAILLWRTCLFVLYAGLGLWLGFVFIVLPAVLVFSLPLVVTTVYSLLSVTNMRAEMKLPKWLFPEDREIQVTRPARPQLPRSLQQARILLYAWWGVVFTYVASQFRPAPLEFGLPFWIAQIALLAAMLWIVVEVTNGKRWARYALLFLFAVSLRSLANLLVSPRSRIDFAVVLVALALLSTALAMVFNKESASYFRQPPQA